VTSGDAAQGDDASRGSLIDIGWEEPPRSAAPHDVPILSAEGFEGPLDWLLDMVRAQKIDLAKLPIADLIQSFVDALEVALARPDGRAPALARWGDWLVMAATLTQLWSRLVLPTDAPEAKAAREEAEALRQQLVEREEMRAAADWLEQRPQLGREVFARGQPEGHARHTGGDITDLLRACLKLLQVPAELAAVYTPRAAPFWGVSEAIARMESLLRERPEEMRFGAFLPAVAVGLPDREARCRAAVASTLVAGLELARTGKVVLGQEGEWGDISVSAGHSC
jgi:segregation and condensation protein A